MPWVKKRIKKKKVRLHTDEINLLISIGSKAIIIVLAILGCILVVFLSNTIYKAKLPDSTAHKEIVGPVSERPLNGPDDLPGLPER